MKLPILLILTLALASITNPTYAQIDGKKIMSEKRFIILKVKGKALVKLRD